MYTQAFDITVPSDDFYFPNIVDMDFSNLAMYIFFFYEELVDHKGFCYQGIQYENLYTNNVLCNWQNNLVI